MTPAAVPTSDPRLLALHGLRLKGVAPAERVAELYSLDSAELEATYQKAAEDELVLLREGRLAGWALTKAGRAEGEALVHAELDALGARATVHDAYLKFHSHNQDMLALCTSWQLKPSDGDPVLNDHDDPNYDREVIENLRAHHVSAAPAFDQLASLAQRFGVFGPRFEAALERLGDGEIDYFTKPVIDSYHTVWFELHEDLLATLGIDRATESEYHESL
jgi:hypothetical protein